MGKFLASLLDLIGLSKADNPIPSAEFYAEYHGHPLEQLRAVAKALRKSPCSIMWLAGDSSLDNKHWLFQGGDKTDSRNYADNELAADAINGYEHLLEPPRMIRDVAYHINEELAAGAAPVRCINTAVEESTLGQRRSGLLKHDELIRDNLQPSDFIVLSVGGNDVALRPSPETGRMLVQLLSSPPGSEQQSEALQHFVCIFKDQTEELLSCLTAKCKPSAVVVCMLYYLDEKPGNGWCEAVLQRMGYNDTPGLIQELISQIFEKATREVIVEGTRVIPVPLFKALDGKTTADYCQRVEPSVIGGGKMARAIVGALRDAGFEV